MTLAYWMLIAAAMLPYLTIALAKSAGGIDNCAQRPSLESPSGWRQRADWAHRNHFEAFPAFAAAVFVAELRRAPQNRIDPLAGIFVLLRVIYTATSANRPTLIAAAVARDCCFSKVFCRGNGFYARRRGVTEECASL